MKKLFLVAFFALAATFYTDAQAQTISDNAIGLRLGGNNGLGAEVSYQRALGGNNRLELDLGWRNDSRKFDAFKLTGLYQWIWNIDGGFNWYVGAGGGLGSVNYNDNRYNYDNETFVFLAGNIGIEYNFDIPLLLSLDFRPELGFYREDVLDPLSPDIALGIRYQF